MAGGVSGWRGGDAMRRWRRRTAVAPRSEKTEKNGAKTMQNSLKTVENGPKTIENNPESIQNERRYAANHSVPTTLVSGRAELGGLATRGARAPTIFVLTAARRPSEKQICRKIARWKVSRRKIIRRAFFEESCLPKNCPPGGRVIVPGD